MNRTLLFLSFCKWEDLPLLTISQAVKVLHDEYGSVEAVGIRLGWSTSMIERCLRVACSETGAVGASTWLSEEDLRTLSQNQLKMKVKRQSVRLLIEELGSMRATARFIDKDSKYVSWLMAQDQNRDMVQTDPPSDARTIARSARVADQPKRNSSHR